MCSYNKVNGQWACENEDVMTGLLKTELGFRGYIMSDWNAQHSTVNSANSGLDMTMPGSDFNNPPGSIYWGPNLAKAIQAGEVPESRLNDMVTRILAAWYLLGQDQGYPPVAFNSFNGGQANVDVTGNHKQVARAVARDSIVLLKNAGKILPLQKPASLAIIGSDAIVNPAGPNACSDRGCDNGTLAMGWGSGTAQFPVSASSTGWGVKQADRNSTSSVPSLRSRNKPLLMAPPSSPARLTIPPRLPKLLPLPRRPLSLSTRTLVKGELIFSVLPTHSYLV